jgi:hypothetical protein
MNVENTHTSNLHRHVPKNVINHYHYACVKFSMLTTACVVPYAISLQPLLVYPLFFGTSAQPA